MRPTSEVPSLLRATAVADRLNVSVWTVRRLVRNGHLQPVRLHATAPYRFRSEDVEALIERGLS